MKRMHANIQEPIVVNGNIAIPVNSEQGKILTACFDAAKNNKPLPYKIYAMCNDERLHEFILANDEKGEYTFVSYGYDASTLQVTAIYHIYPGTIETGDVYYINEF